MRFRHIVLMLKLILGLLLLTYFIRCVLINTYSDLWIFIPQLLIIFPIMWFLNKTADVIFEEISEQQTSGNGAIPILALIYMGFVIYYTMMFIGNFDGFLNGYEKNVSSNVEPIPYFVSVLKFLIAVTFIAFISNFYKSLFTIHSLEFGKFGGRLTLRNIFDSNKIKVFGEILFITIIVILFILLEKELAEPHFLTKLVGMIINIPSNSDAALLLEIGVLVSLLYLVMIIWLLYVNKFTTSINRQWFAATIVQFICGFLVGATLFILGRALDNNYATSIILSIAAISILASLGVLLTIGLNEFKFRVD